MPTKNPESQLKNPNNPKANWKPEQFQKPTQTPKNPKSQLKTRTIPKAN
jgi:hypothetical protein